jgi:parallel beta-helix repeat protein
VRAVVSGNRIHDNLGTGLWFDGGSRDARIVGNRVSGNRAGILYKTSSAAAITANVVDGNGVGADHWLFGAQICLYDSERCEVSWNTAVVSAAGGNGIALIVSRGEGGAAPRVIGNRVHGNTVIHLGAAGVSGMGTPDAGTRLDASNVFDGNTYRVAAAARSYWQWPAGVGWDALRALGQERTGTLDPKVPDGPALQKLLDQAPRNMQPRPLR